MTERNELLSALRSGLVNLEGHASSPGFVGYFESSGALPRRQAAGLAVRAIFDSSRPWTAMGNPHIFGCLEKVVKKFVLPAQDVEAYLSPLLAHGWLRAYDHYSHVPAPAILGDGDPDLVTKACIALMDIDGLKGHFFLHQDDIVFYPHEEVGFGAIALNDSARGKAKGLLQGLADDKAWRIHLFPLPHQLPSASAARRFSGK